MTPDLAQLYRRRWAVRATLSFALAVSLAANVLHAPADPVSRTIAAWPPLALLLTVELISRVPASTRWMSVSRIAATAVIAGIAAWISYWHMTGVAAAHGESNHGSQYLWALTVDGLAIVASICLVEIGRQITAHSGSEPLSREPVKVREPEPVEPLGDPVYVSLPPEPEPVSVEPYEMVEPEPVEPVSPGMGPVAHDPELEPFDEERWESRLNEPLAHPDPWLRAEPVKPRKPEPVKPEPVIRKLQSLGREPVEPADAEPDDVETELARVLGVEPAVLRLIGSAETVPEKVAMAHGAEPNATNERLAQLAGVSLASVKRHRPPRDSKGSRHVA